MNQLVVTGNETITDKSDYAIGANLGAGLELRMAPNGISMYRENISFQNILNSLFRSRLFTILKAGEGHTGDDFFLSLVIIY